MAVPKTVSAHNTDFRSHSKAADFCGFEHGVLDLSD